MERFGAAGATGGPGSGAGWYAVAPAWGPTEDETLRIVCIGGGPASLFFSILMRKAYPDADVSVYERNRADDTFGWGVVFSDETLGNIEEADPESLARIRANFAYWGDIDTYVHDERVRSTGHGFCGLARKRMLEILHERARALGVLLRFEHEIDDFERYLDADLVVAADGVNSVVRERWAEHFRPHIEWGKARFTWLGTTKPLDAFTFIFRENEHGLFQVHAYPFEADRSTFIVECHEEVWRRAGLDQATEEQTVTYMEALFGDHLEGHRLLTNRSIWRSFPTIRCERWHHENVVLLGDAVAHGALLDRLGHEARNGGRHRARGRVPRPSGEGRTDRPRGLRGRALARRPQAAEGRRDEPDLVREHRALPPPTAAALHLQPDDALEADHVRQPGGPRPGAGGGRHGGLRGAPRRARDRPTASPRPRCSPRSAWVRSRSPTAWSSRRCASTRRWTGSSATGTSSTSVRWPWAARASSSAR